MATEISEANRTASASHSVSSSSTVNSTKPGHLNVIKRNGKVVTYDEAKIAIALTKAFLDVEGSSGAASTYIRDIVNKLTKKVTNVFEERRSKNGDMVWIEDIQDQVELALMRADQEGLSPDFARRVAVAYVLYRNQRSVERKQEESQSANPAEHVIHVTMRNGEQRALDNHFLNNLLNAACKELTDVSPESILKDTKRNLFDGVPIDDVHKALVMVARTHVEKEVNYTYVAARLLLTSLCGEAFRALGMQDDITFSDLKKLYPKYLKKYLDKGIEIKLLDPRLKTDFDLAKIGAALQADRDLKFSYLSMQTLYDRYFLHNDGQRFELPQVFFMRVAMGLALEEDKPTERAIEFYNLLSTFTYMSSTPTLFNSGTLHSQLSSCYLTTVPDDLGDIYSAIRDNALLQKYAGGIGNDWTYVRGMNAKIKGTNGQSQGSLLFMKVANDTAVAVNQGGKRKGAVCGYLETWHIDIEEFLELRKNTGDDRRRTHDMNTANWVPDLFIERVIDEADWTLFSPEEAPDLHDLYGSKFKSAYEAYEAKAQRGELRNWKKVSAVKLWRKMLGMLFETGHPWVTFKDVCNLRSPQQHAGVVHSSNLCTEITLNTSADEIAVCNLGSINLPEHVDENGINTEKLEKTVKTALRMLDNVIDINYYAVPQARRSNLRHRPVGMGLMGFQDALYKLNIKYGSDEAIEFADRSMELISYYAIQASTDLAEERGPYQTYEGSLWSQGILPIDSIKLVRDARNKPMEQDMSQTLEWDRLRERVRTAGMRNSNVMAIAPTATISNICGVSQSIEPTYQNLFVKSNLSGEFTIVNPYLAADLKQLDMWDDVMVNDLKYFNGSVQQIERIPQQIKEKYATAFELDPKWLIEAASRRQKWIDQAQSLNIYMAQPSGKKLDAIYKLAWTKGLKTTYYLRSMGATNTEKSTISDGALNAVQPAAKACSITDPDCEACQ